MVISSRLNEVFVLEAERWYHPWVEFEKVEASTERLRDIEEKNEDLQERISMVLLMIGQVCDIILVVVVSYSIVALLVSGRGEDMGWVGKGGRCVIF